MNAIFRRPFTVLGQVHPQQLDEIGSATFLAEGRKLTTNARFVLSLDYAPCNFERVYLLPTQGELPPVFATVYRLCDAKNESEDDVVVTGLGKLIPAPYDALGTQHYFELVPDDLGFPLWKTGRFCARLDPYEDPDFVTLSYERAA